jgi:hypothetical protein
VISEHCPGCGGQIERPCLPGCPNELHAGPDLSERIVARLETELAGHPGIGWSKLEGRARDELRERLEVLVREVANLGHGDDY